MEQCLASVNHDPCAGRPTASAKSPVTSPVTISRRAEGGAGEGAAYGWTADRERDPSALDQVAPTEQQTAGLVAEGLANAEIAARLFLSIGYHLRKVFTKLEIASRTELARQVLPGPHARLKHSDWRSRRCEHSLARGIVEACDQTQPPPAAGGSRGGS